jgi:hypothetical protein
MTVAASRFGMVSSVSRSRTNKKNCQAGGGITQAGTISNRPRTCVNFDYIGSNDGYIEDYESR